MAVRIVGVDLPQCFTSKIADYKKFWKEVLF